MTEGMREGLCGGRFGAAAGFAGGVSVGLARAASVGLAEGASVRASGVGVFIAASSLGPALPSQEEPRMCHLPSAQVGSEQRKQINDREGDEARRDTVLAPDPGPALPLAQ